MQYQIYGDSAEAVALELFDCIRQAEGRAYGIGERRPADREWILATYAECLAVVRRGSHDRSPADPVMSTLRAVVPAQNPEG
jgi:hypothetical protein